MENKRKGGLKNGERDNNKQCARTRVLDVLWGGGPEKRLLALWVSFSLFGDSPGLNL